MTLTIVKHSCGRHEIHLTSLLLPLVFLLKSKRAVQRLLKLLIRAFGLTAASA